VSQKYFCCDERRRGVINGHLTLNGIDFIEVLDHDSMPLTDRQKTLFVHFINNPSGLVLNKDNVIIEGGERDKYLNPKVIAAKIKIDSRSGSSSEILVVEVKQVGDFSLYTLKLIVEQSAPNALDNVDPILRSVDFSFKANCKSDFDCLSEAICPPKNVEGPQVDYLVKDFSSFRQLMLDRMNLLVPAWKNKNVADGGVALIEVLAYVADYMSYRQDAIATEAYLDTARKRISISRHVRLIDYRLHNGSNARVWMHIEVSQNTILTTHSQFVATTAGYNNLIVPKSNDHNDIVRSGAEVFESMEPVSLFPEHNTLNFYTWGNRNCCLPIGSIKASIRGRFSKLKVGMVLIFVEQFSPTTGIKEDANIMHRHAVRLTKVSVNDVDNGDPIVDPIGGQFDQPPTSASVEITEIEWALEDALPFPVCISSETETQAKGNQAIIKSYVNNVSIVLGNIVLADHGRLISKEDIGTIAEPHLQLIENAESNSGSAEKSDAHCNGIQLVTVASRNKFTLDYAPLTYAMPIDKDKPAQSAYESMHWQVADTIPSITLNSGEWQAQYDLLGSGTSRDFVIELETKGEAYLRFGDGIHGRKPNVGTKFIADYRIGNGIRGNVGSDVLTHLVSNNSKINAVKNPMPAFGGQEIETIKHARENAPKAFRDLLRAVTPGDYEQKTNELNDVQSSVAALRWTGSWHTTFISVDRVAGKIVDENVKSGINNYLQQFRLAGHDLEIDSPKTVPLKVGLIVNVNCSHERSNVHNALLQVFSHYTLSNGIKGLLHPDNFSFGKSVYLSQFYTSAQEVEGVDSVEIKYFQRQDTSSTEGIEQGFLEMGRNEIPRLRNNINYPGQGVLELEMRGGR